MFAVVITGPDVPISTDGRQPGDVAAELSGELRRRRGEGRGR